MLLRPPAAHSAIGKISISEAPALTRQPRRDRSYQIARLFALSVSSKDRGRDRRTILRTEIDRFDRKQRGEVIDTESREVRETLEILS